MANTAVNNNLKIRNLEFFFSKKIIILVSYRCSSIIYQLNDYDKFKIRFNFCKKRFGIVNRVVTDDGMKVALKVLIDQKTLIIEEDDIKMIVNEIKLVRIISFYQNINGFLGITKVSYLNLREEPIEVNELKTIKISETVYDRCTGFASSNFKNLMLFN
ncbi:hypothetical protein C1646_661773 [Rhizophagus diaphanus]|nr:hypothetical protein C1646_661773 [Rhizophagus diaphanus] [Rhizophagus sp. MUCL 43196]